MQVMQFKTSSLLSVAAKGTTFLKATHSLATLTMPIHVYSNFTGAFIMCNDMPYSSSCCFISNTSPWSVYITYIRCLAGYWLPFTAGASEETCPIHGTWEVDVGWIICLDKKSLEFVALFSSI